MPIWNTVAQDIEEKTQNYWRISQAWNNRSQEPIATGEAIVVCIGNTKYTNPTRPIYYRSTTILKEIVEGQSSPRPEKSRILEFPDTCAIGV